MWKLTKRFIAFILSPLLKLFGWSEPDYPEFEQRRKEYIDKIPKKKGDK
jgi:hypothetical protein